MPAGSATPVRRPRDGGRPDIAGRKQFLLTPDGNKSNLTAMEQYYGTLEKMLVKACENGASDVFICPGAPVSAKISGVMTPIADFGTLSVEDTNRLLKPIIPDKKLSCLEEYGDVDFGKVAGGCDTGEIRFRASVFRQRSGLSAVFRRISTSVPSLSDLNLPEAVARFAGVRRGLVLVVGPTGSGKTSTLSALLKEIMMTRKGHVITIEDPIEYIHGETGGCIINQREVGADTASFARALRGALRQAPDIILLGEMRDAETALTAIQAAETGHLVLSTLHTGKATEAPSRLIDLFPEMERGAVAASLAACLEGVVAQQLLPAKRGGRIPVCEIMIGTQAVRSQIRAQKFEQLGNALQTGRAQGMITMDRARTEAEEAGLLA